MAIVHNTLSTTIWTDFNTIHNTASDPHFQNIQETWIDFYAMKKRSKESKFEELDGNRYVKTWWRTSDAESDDADDED